VGRGELDGPGGSVGEAVGACSYFKVASSSFASGIYISEPLDDAIFVKGFVAIACALLIALSLAVKHDTSELWERVFDYSSIEFELCASVVPVGRGELDGPGGSVDEAVGADTGTFLRRRFGHSFDIRYLHIITCYVLIDSARTFLKLNKSSL
jgi:hypothetical protein